MKKVFVSYSILSCVVLLFAANVFAQTTQKAELIVQTGHSEKITSIAFSPNGKMLVSGGEDSKVILWNIEDGMMVKRFDNKERVDSAAFSPDGKMIAAAGRKTTRVWNIETGEQIDFSESGKNYKYETIISVVFSPDSRNFVSLHRHSREEGTGATINLWEIKTGRLIKSLSTNLSFEYSTPHRVSFAPGGQALLLNSEKYKTVDLLDIVSGKVLKTFEGDKAKFMPDGKIFVNGEKENVLYDVASGQQISFPKDKYDLDRVFSPDSKIFAYEREGGSNLQDSETGETHYLSRNYEPFAFSPDGKIFAGINYDKVNLVNVDTKKTVKSLESLTSVFPNAISPSAEIVAAGGFYPKLWNMSKGQIILSFEREKYITTLAFSPNGKFFATGDDEGNINLRSAATGEQFRLLTERETKLFTKRLNEDDTTANPEITALKFSPSGKILVSVSLISDSGKRTIQVFDVMTGRIIKTLESSTGVIDSIGISSDDKTLAAGSSAYAKIELWDIASGQAIKSFQTTDAETEREVSAVVPDYYAKEKTIDPTGRFQIELHPDSFSYRDAKSGKVLAQLTPLGEKNWIVTTPDGRFDTNQSLDNIKSLGWIISTQPLKALPPDVFMRQYYEPNLLQRILKCNEENDCDREFKPLPSIADINRVQPKVSIKEIKPAADSTDAADVIIEVENVTEDVSFSATDQTERKRLSSGAFDLRLFRDGQLIGVSAPKNKLETFIKDAPRLAAETKSSGKLINTPEDAAWREANDVFALKGENIKTISSTKIEYTFRSVRLPKDGRKEVEFTAYAFNADKVKSVTTAPMKFSIPNSIQTASKKGRAVVISIGVNASENPAFNLRYAANDARKMQEIVGARLKADAAKYSEIVQIPLISDYGADKNLRENSAQKAVIKSVFSLLAGNEKEVSPEILAQIPNRKKILAIAPEDTLIITYAGHGYADNAGIFYLLPYDIGNTTTKLTAEALRKMISSDELSLWMQDITAAEMIMVIDACHSAAAVQGAGFKPGPMGSRGLGQLAYDKDMKILSATQANNVALELNSLEQGLLSYALLQDGIVSQFADNDKDKKLFSDEWLSYAERRVPELYEEVKAGKRGMIVDGRNVSGDAMRSELGSANTEGKSNLQQPSLFDFKRRNAKNNLFILP